MSVKDMRRVSGKILASAFLPHYLLTNPRRERRFEMCDRKPYISIG